MNKVELIGRLTRDPEVRSTAGDNPRTITRYTLAVDRKRNDNTDFISCVAFGAPAEFAEKYFHKGIKIAVIGRIQTGSYTKQDGTKIWTTEVVVEEQEFAEGKSSGSSAQTSMAPEPTDDDGFMTVPDGDEDPNDIFFKF